MGTPYLSSVMALGAAIGDNTTGGQALATIAAVDLTPGMYQIDVYSQMTTITNANVSNAVELRAGATSLIRLINHVVAQNSGAYGPKQPFTVYRRLDGATALSLNWAQNLAATETQAWTVCLVATKLGF